MSAVSPRSVFITGTNRGLGFEMVKQLTELKDPPKVIFATYRKADGAKELFKFAETNKSVRPVQFDVRDVENYQKIVDEVSSVVGSYGLNLLINNAAIAHRSDFWTVTREEMLEAVEVNTVVPTLLARAFVPLLQKGFDSSNGTPFTWSRATVINISSLLGSIANSEHFTLDGMIAYKTSKTALNMITRVLSFDLKQKNILMVAVHPGWVQTDMGGPQAPLKSHDSISSVLSTLKNLTEESNGGFVSFDGKRLEY